MNELIPLIIIIPIIAALLLNILHGKDVISKVFALIIAILVPLVVIFSNLGLHYFGGYAPLMFNPTNYTLPSDIVNSTLMFFHPAITYRLENLGKLFLTMLGIVIFLGIFTYFSKYKKVSGPLLFLIFMGTASVSAMLLTDDIFNLYIFFEIAAIAQTGIILASKTPNCEKTALKYMILGAIGGSMLLLGIGFILGAVGSVNISDIVLTIKTGGIDPFSPVLILGFGLISFGWLYASGLPPFNTVKALVYSKGTPETSAILTTFSVLTLLALGIVIFRIFGYMEIYTIVLLIFAILAMVLGVVMAIIQTDFRKILGFLAVGELGFIVLGFAIGTKQSMTAALFHSFNDIVITSLMFIGFGTVHYLTQTSDTRKLGGLITNNPKMSIMVLIGGLALAGVPPLNGFQSKLLLVQSALNAGYLELAIIIIVISIVVFMTFVKAFHAIYLKPKPSDLTLVNENIPSVAVFAVAILLLICIITGLFPEIITNIFTQYLGGLI